MCAWVLVILLSLKLTQVYSLLQKLGPNLGNDVILGELDQLKTKINHTPQLSQDNPHTLRPTTEIPSYVVLGGIK